MKTLTAFITTLCLATAVANTAMAATLSCSALKKAYNSDAIYSHEFKCSTPVCEDRQLSQLKQTIAFFTDSKESKGTLKQLTDKYQAYFTTYSIGTKSFESANIDLGDNGFELLFDSDTAHFSGIDITDGTPSVDKKYCEDLEFRAIITPKRIENICGQVVPEIKKQLPNTTYNMSTCTNQAPVDKETGNATDFQVSRSDEKSLEVTVGRNLHDLGGGYFNCTAKLNRKSDYVYSLSCQAQ